MSKQRTLYIGSHFGVLNFFEEDGSPGQPIMAWGWFPTLDDIAKVATLLHERGEHDGVPVEVMGTTDVNGMVYLVPEEPTTFLPDTPYTLTVSADGYDEEEEQDEYSYEDYCYDFCKAERDEEAWF